MKAVITDIVPANNNCRIFYARKGKNPGTFPDRKSWFKKVKSFPGVYFILENHG